MYVNAVLIFAPSNPFPEGTLMARVVDEWIADTQEFIHSKLPHIIRIV